MILVLTERREMKILWISRHVPQPPQVAALQNKFGDVTILIPTDDPAAPVWTEWDGVQQIVGFTLPNPREVPDTIRVLLNETGADEIVGVMPVPHLAALTRVGIQPLRAVMERVPTGRTLDNGEVEYRFDFDHFERIVKVEVVTERL